MKDVTEAPDVARTIGARPASDTLSKEGSTVEIPFEIAGGLQTGRAG